jgi:hypothetical protein
MPGNDRQESILDKKSVSLGIKISLGFPVAMAVLPNPTVIDSVPLLPIEPGACEFILPYQPIGTVKTVGIPGGRGFLVRLACPSLTPDRDSRQKQDRDDGGDRVGCELHSSKLDHLVLLLEPM